MNWEAVGIILGGLGGIELLKFIYNLFVRRKTDERVAIAEAQTAVANAHSAEFNHLKETNEWLQQQLQHKEERFEEQTGLVRRQNTEILNLTSQLAEKDIQHAKEISDLEIKHAKELAAKEIELVEVKCLDKPCPFRQPPNAYTQPKPGLTKEQYHAQKSKENDDNQERKQG